MSLGEAATTRRARAAGPVLGIVNQKSPGSDRGMPYPHLRMKGDMEGPGAVRKSNRMAKLGGRRRASISRVASP